ncbi:MAG: hypothetical protein U5J83_10315 [Bryobacterales bacterium]|nr:hypothetical protein [Bryobacterales bacterium]
MPSKSRLGFPAYTIAKRVDPTYNQMGAMTHFGYGTPGSLYSYSYTFDNANRPATMTEEGLTLVENVIYNGAGAVTNFRRNEGTGTPVDNSYAFNHLLQMTNQTVVRGVTTVQNLTYTFSATQNNGQILSQTDAISAETVVYTYL